MHLTVETRNQVCEQAVSWMAQTSPLWTLTTELELVQLIFLFFFNIVLQSISDILIKKTSQTYIRVRPKTSYIWMEPETISVSSHHMIFSPTLQSAPLFGACWAVSSQPELSKDDIQEAAKHLLVAFFTWSDFQPNWNLIRVLSLRHRHLSPTEVMIWW